MMTSFFPRQKIDFNVNVSICLLPKDFGTNFSYILHTANYRTLRRQRRKRSKDIKTKRYVDVSKCLLLLLIALKYQLHYMSVMYT